MTTQDGRPDEEPSVSQESEETKSSSKTPFSGLSDSITEDELKNAKSLKLITKMLLGEVKRLKQEIGDLRNFKDRFYEAHEKAAVLAETLANLEGSVGARSAIFVLAGLLLGFLPTLWSNQTLNFLFWPAAIIGVALLVVAWYNPSFLRRK
ncbi:MAG: hypothetical protein HY473_01915 [Candidatus Sungbacteria bacterium]|uniref:Uncharacterized protein n=1 Tax=Candidatus Sungiibacteriota bacterium TaxID=2750080 RepID=A0A933DTF2_9BACT|nr:hypothetical protein [Candidatus Sungbacteria bacterium]